LVIEQESTYIETCHAANEDTSWPRRLTFSFVFATRYSAIVILRYKRHPDGKHTVYGRVLDDASMLTVRKCEAVPVNGTEPRIPLRVVQCGEL
jgi:hypothetical protein